MRPNPDQSREGSLSPENISSFDAGDYCALGIRSANRDTASLGEVCKPLGGISATLHPNAFGRADLANLYRKATDFIVRHKIFRIAQYTEEGGIRQLTICNLWRIERSQDASVRTFEFRLTTGVWEEVDTLEHWPEVPFYPVNLTKSLGWWRSIAQQAIWKAIIAAGYFELPRYIGEAAKSEFGETQLTNQTPVSKKEMSPGRLAKIIVARYLGRDGPYNKRRKAYDRIGGLLDPKSMEAGARALRAAIFQHILDRDVLSAMLVIDYRDTSFVRYLHFARHRAGLLKVASEHRNLLPLLSGIDPAQWGRDDLFSRKLWVRDGRQSTALDRRPIRTANARGIHDRHWVPLESFDDGTAWRWLSKASSVTIREWVGKPNTVITNLALANVNFKAPAYAYMQIVRTARRLDPYRVSLSIQRLLRLFLAHSAKIWRDMGYNSVRLWLRDSPDSRISDMLDYLDAEGFEQGFPDKHSTWVSLLRRSEDWHHRIAIERMDTQREGCSFFEWTSILPPTIIDDIIFTPLNDSRALAMEGFDLDHCVGDYDVRCQRDFYRVYSVLEPDGVRSTLGFKITGGSVLWDQHQAKYRKQPSKSAQDAGKKLCIAYQRAMTVAPGR